jgi:hypothetical protein
VAQPKWLLIARNEYRINTSRIRKIRPYFPFLVTGVLAVYVAFIAPAFAQLFLDDFLAVILSQTAIALMQVILFMIFLYFLIIPVSSTLRQEQTGQLEVFLAAPIKPSDVLLGEFLGNTPFYAIFMTVIMGAFTAVLKPLGLDVMQMAIIILIFLVTLLSALWIGTVIAALLRTKLAKTARGRDVGRALAMIIALPLVFLVYVIQYGGLLEVLADPETSGVINAILGLVPSSWGAEVIVGFATHPGNIPAVGFDTWTRCGGLLCFFLAALGLGARAAGRAYSLEPTSFSASEARPDGAFYQTIRSVGGRGSFSTLLVSVFKDYSRRLENLSNILYMTGVLFIMVIFVVPKAGPMGPLYIYMMAQFVFPILVVMITGEVTVRGKDSLFLFRKAPSGEGKLVKAMLMKGWLMAIPIAGGVTAVATALSPQATVISVVTNTGFMSLFIAAYTAFVLGLFFLNPAFSAKSLRLPLNVIITILASIGLFAASLLTLMRLGIPTETGEGMLYVQLFQTVLSWLVGLVVLYLGKRRLSRME